MTTPPTTVGVARLVQPPRGSVKVSAGTDGRYVAACASCGWTYTNSVKSDVDTHKRWHQCAVAS